MTPLSNTLNTLIDDYPSTMNKEKLRLGGIFMIKVH